MIRKLVNLAKSLDGRTVIAFALVTYGLSMLQQIAGERQEQIEELDQLIAGKSSEAERSIWPTNPPYPARADVDPLDRAAADEDRAPAQKP